jgi:hypothetical protein
MAFLIKSGEWGSGGRWFKSSRPDHKNPLRAGKMKGEIHLTLH